MKKLSEKIVFYFVIINENEIDQKNLRSLIRSQVPQAIIESIYDLKEAISYFEKTTMCPHVIFISEQMSKAGINALSWEESHAQTSSPMPLVLLSDKKPAQHEEQLTYSKPYDPKNFLSIVGSVNHKRVA